MSKILILLGMLTLTASCARKTSAPATTYAAPTAAPTDSTGRVLIPGEGINREREQLVGRLDNQVNDINSRIDDLEKQSRDIKKQRRELEKQRKSLQRSAKDLKKYDATAEWEKRKDKINQQIESAEKR